MINSIIFFNGFKRKGINAWNYTDDNRYIGVFDEINENVPSYCFEFDNDSYLLSFEEIAKTIHKNINDLPNIKPPYLLLSHSIGGLYAMTFIKLFPDVVSYAVFLDSTQKTHVYLEKLLDRIDNKDNIDELDAMDCKIYQNWIDNFNQIPDAHNIPAKIAVISVMVLKTFDVTKNININEYVLNQSSKLKFNKQLTNKNKLSRLITYVDDNHMVYFSHPEQIKNIVLSCLQK